MANYQLLKADIDKKVYQNGHQEITGENLNFVLNQMVTTLGAGYQFAGVATIGTNPGSPDAKVFYIANGKGTYTNFGGIEVTEDEVVVLYWDSSWHKVSTGIAPNDKLIRLVGLNISYIKAVGDVYYNPVSNKLYKCINYPWDDNDDFEEVPFYDGAIYTYRDSLYRYDGNSLKEFNPKEKSILLNEISSTITWVDGKLVNSLFNTIQNVPGFRISNRIFLEQGTLIQYLSYGSSNNIGIVTKVDSKGNVLKVCAVSHDETVVKEYYIDEAGYYILGYQYNQAANFVRVYSNAQPFYNDNISLNILESKDCSYVKDMAINATTKVRNEISGCRLSVPIFVNKGNKIVVSTSATNVGLVCESSDGVHIDDVLLLSNTETIREYIAQKDVWVVITYLEGGWFKIYKDNYYSDALSEENATKIAEQRSLINNLSDTISQYVPLNNSFVALPFQIQLNGTIGGDANYAHTTPISLKSGDIIKVGVSTGNVSVISETDEHGTHYTPLIVISSPVEPYTIYSYTAESDMYVSVSYPLISEHHIFVNDVELLPTVEAKPVGVYLYPFRTIANKDIYLFKDSLISVANADGKYFITPPEGSPAINYSERAIKFNKPAGNYTCQIMAIDEDCKLAANKFVNIEVKNAPLSKLSNGNIDVFFMGDSIISYNNNLIGKEWHRMLTTSGGAETQSDGAVLLDGLNVCPNKISLVGEINGNGTKYQYFLGLKTIVNSKRTIQYGDTAGQSPAYWMSNNPFYNPNSLLPDEIDVDGFNKRVDFAWYFENACGAGKYPKLIYLSIGANDIANDMWSGDNILLTTQRLVNFCKRIKAGADTIAGGDSGITIKIFNHQVYPQILASELSIPVSWAKAVRRALYDSYYEAITNPANGINTFVEFVDCASKFDWHTGYTEYKVSTNVRYSQETDKIIPSCIHMNPIGAYNYADTLVYDFLADSRFD